jgi:hypothetical protein
MLREIRGVRQDDPGAIRRWFQDDYLDLFLWITSQGKVSAFQLAYARTRDERVLSWSRTRGFSHSRVDSGESGPFDSRTPLLIADDVCPIRVVYREFERRSTTLDGRLRTFLMDKLRQGRRMPRFRRKRKYD